MQQLRVLRVRSDALTEADGVWSFQDEPFTGVGLVNDQDSSSWSMLSYQNGVLTGPHVERMARWDSSLMVVEADLGPEVPHPLYRDEVVDSWDGKPFSGVLLRFDGPYLRTMEYWRDQLTADPQLLSWDEDGSLREYNYEFGGGDGWIPGRAYYRWGARGDLTTALLRPPQQFVEGEEGRGAVPPPSQLAVELDEHGRLVDLSLIGDYFGTASQFRGYFWDWSPESSSELCATEIGPSVRIVVEGRDSESVVEEMIDAGCFRKVEHYQVIGEAISGQFLRRLLSAPNELRSVVVPHAGEELGEVVREAKRRHPALVVKSGGVQI